MGQQHVGSEHAEVVEVHDRAPAGAGQVGAASAGVGDRWNVSPVPVVGGELAGGHDQLVGHQVVADERHPAVDAGVARVEVERVALAVEHVGHRTRPRAVGDVPAPRSERAADADAVERRQHPVGVGDGAGLDGERDAVGGGVDEGQRGRQLVVVGRVGGVDRHGPREDGVVRRDVVGDRRAHEAIAGEVLVGVDKARQHEVPGTADDGRARHRRGDLGPGTDGDDAVAADGDGPVGDHPPLASIVIDDVADHEQVGHRSTVRETANGRRRRGWTAGRRRR